MTEGITDCPSCGYKPNGRDDPFFTAHGGKGECPKCGIIISKSFSRSKRTILDAEIDLQNFLSTERKEAVVREFVSIFKRPLVFIPASVLLIAMLSVIYIDSRDDWFTDKKVDNVVASIKKKESQKKECFEGAAKEAKSDQGFRVLAAKCLEEFEEDTAELNQKYMRLTAQPISRVYKDKLSRAHTFCSRYVVGNNELLGFYERTNNGDHLPGVFLQVNCKSVAEKTGDNNGSIESVLNEEQRLKSIRAISP